MAVAPLPSLRERLVRKAAKILGRVPAEHALRCIPIRKRLPGTEEMVLVEWRATFEASGREWSAPGADRDEALKAVASALDDEVASKRP